MFVRPKIYLNISFVACSREQGATGEEGEACSKLVYQRLSRVRILDMCVRNTSWIHPHHARTHTHTPTHTLAHTFSCTFVCFPLICSRCRCYFLCVCIFNSFLISRYFFRFSFLVLFNFFQNDSLPFPFVSPFSPQSTHCAYSNWYKNLTSCGRLFRFVLFYFLCFSLWFVICACFCVFGQKCHAFFCFAFSWICHKLKRLLYPTRSLSAVREVRLVSRFIYATNRSK